MHTTDWKSCTTHTPWGRADQSRRLAYGVMLYSTPGHGGIHLSPKRNMEIPEPFRTNGWYEEDCEASIVYHFILNETPNDDDIRCLKDYFWKAWEQHYDVTLSVTESSGKADYMYKRDNENRFVSISALHYDETYVSVVMLRRSDNMMRTYLVPRDIYICSGRQLVWESLSIGERQLCFPMSHCGHVHKSNDLVTA
jgi:hypothetical protein